jgi:hypothetical protein
LPICNSTFTRREFRLLPEARLIVAAKKEQQTMGKKTSHLKIVDQQTAKEAEQKKKWAGEVDRWNKTEDEMRISSEEARRRVRDLRHELERYRDQIGAVPFDIPGEMPICLDTKRKYTIDLVETFDTRIEARFEMIDKFAELHGCHANLDFNAELFDLKMHTAETAFKIGVLAGQIFSGASDREIDRLERGLAFSLMSDSRIVKSGD